MTRKKKAKGLESFLIAWLSFLADDGDRSLVG